MLIKLLFFLQWKCLHWLLSAVRSEKILASQMHTPAPPNCSFLTNSLDSPGVAFLILKCDCTLPI